MGSPSNCGDVGPSKQDSCFLCGNTVLEHSQTDSKKVNQFTSMLVDMSPNLAQVLEEGNKQNCGGCCTMICTMWDLIHQEIKIILEKSVQLLNIKKKGSTSNGPGREDEDDQDVVKRSVNEFDAGPSKSSAVPPSPSLLDNRSDPKNLENETGETHPDFNIDVELDVKIGPEMPKQMDFEGTVYTSSIPAEFCQVENLAPFFPDCSPPTNEEDVYILPDQAPHSKCSPVEITIFDSDDDDDKKPIPIPSWSSINFEKEEVQESSEDETVPVHEVADGDDDYVLSEDEEQDASAESDDDVLPRKRRKRTTTTPTTSNPGSRKKRKGSTCSTSQITPTPKSTSTRVRIDQNYTPDGRIIHCPHPSCKKQVCSRTGLNRHLEKAHSLHRCEICGKYYTSRWDLTAHMTEIHAY